MSSSISNSAILLTDKPDEIKKKVNKYAMSGGGQTVEEHRANGANLDIDVPFQYLQFFLEDDEKLDEIEKKYSSGEMLTGEVKQVLIKCLQEFVKQFQERRKKVTNKDVEAFMKVRKIDPFPKRWNKGGASAAESKPKKQIEKATLDAYEKTLTDNQYLGGMLPTATDKEVFESFVGADIDPVAYPAVYAWFMLIGKFAPKIRDTWKGGKSDKKSKDKDAPKKNDKKQEKKPAPKKEEDDDLDLFGGDAEADAKAAADAKAKNQKKKAKAAPVAKSLIVWDVKPWGQEIDLDAMAAEILKIQQDGLMWKTEYKKEPVAFGVFKLVIGATVEDEKVSTDDLQEKIEALEDMVQSVDIVAFNKV